MKTHNPYAPPTTPVFDTAPPMVVVRKPVSVWLLQIVCALAALVILIALPNSFEAWRVTPPGAIARVALIVSLLLQLMVATLFIWTTIAAQRRSQFGRWLGVFMMGILISILVFAFYNAGILGRDAVTALVLSPMGLLVYFSAFSKRARAWYAKPSVP